MKLLLLTLLPLAFGASFRNKRQYGPGPVCPPSVQPANNDPNCEVISTTDHMGCMQYSVECSAAPAGYETPDNSMNGGTDDKDMQVPEMEETEKEVVKVEPCAPVPDPTPTPNCREYNAIHDNRFCIIGYICATPAPPPPQPAATTRKPCEYLNPSEHADVHPESDSNCRFGAPGWTGDETCRCSYLVKERDDGNCVTRYWMKCVRPGVPKCPVPVFDLPKPGCVMILVENAETGCREAQEDCSVPTEEEVEENIGEKKEEPKPNPMPTKEEMKPVDIKPSGYFH